MKLIHYLYFVNVGYSIRLNLPNRLCFLCNSLQYTASTLAFPTKTKQLDESESPDCMLTDDDLKNINDYLTDIKKGLYGSETQKQFENLKTAEESTIPENSLNLKDILNNKNDEFEEQMNKVFDLSNLTTDEGESVNWDDLENRISDDKKGLDTDELKKIVRSLYREKGLLNEPFKVLEISGVKLNWRQTLDHLEIFFTVESTTRKGDYDIQFLPSSLTIRKHGDIILQKDLAGKVDCDGCFWTMYKNPSSNLKYININLSKRKPKFNNMWDRLFE